MKLRDVVIATLATLALACSTEVDHIASDTGTTEIDTSVDAENGVPDTGSPDTGATDTGTSDTGTSHWYLRHGHLRHGHSRHWHH